MVAKSGSSSDHRAPSWPTLDRKFHAALVSRSRFKKLMKTPRPPSTMAAVVESVVASSKTPVAKGRKISKFKFWKKLKTAKRSPGGICNSHGSTWVRDRKLGEGGFGSVFLAKSNEPNSEFPSEFAVKSAVLAESSTLQHEKEILSALNGSPYLVRYYGDEITDSETDAKIYNLILEFCSGSTLRSQIAKSSHGLPLNQVIGYARDIVRGLAYMHLKGYIHCDIKPENILLVPNKCSDSEYTAKIADFGLTTLMFEVCTGLKGTYRYMAPEMVRDNSDQIIYWPVDIWALGCVVLEMMTGKPVWGSEFKDKNELLEHIRHTDESPEIPSGITEEAKDFLNKCFTRKDYGFGRLNAVRLLKHPFIREDLVS